MRRILQKIIHCSTERNRMNEWIKKRKKLWNRKIKGEYTQRERERGKERKLKEDR